MYVAGQGVSKDIAEAVRWYQFAAEQGAADAQFNVGIAYRSGLGVLQDAAEAGRWFRLSAEQGVSVAQFVLGNMYEYGVLAGQAIFMDDTTVKLLQKGKGKGRNKTKTADYEIQTSKLSL
jgi:TPR repeat protein